MTAHRTSEKKISEFTDADRQLLTDTAEGVKAISEFLFGDPKTDRVSLVIKIDRNTNFRKGATAVLLLVCSAILSIIAYLVTH